MHCTHCQADFDIHTNKYTNKSKASRQLIDAITNCYIISEQHTM